jgi:hypothetical protein
LASHLLAQSVPLTPDSVSALIRSSIDQLQRRAQDVASQRRHFLELVQCSVVEEAGAELKQAVDAEVDVMVEKMLARLLVDAVGEVVGNEEEEE